jgi:hypothetical protein
MKAIVRSLMGGGALAAVLLGGIPSGSAAGWTWSTFSAWMTCAQCLPDQKTHTFSNPTETVTARTVWSFLPPNPRHDGVGFMQPWTDYNGPTSVATEVELDCTNGTVKRNSIYSRDEDYNEVWSNDYGVGKCNPGGYLRRSRLRVGRYQD